ncbi:MAG TPA: hypothetical protein VH328_12185, partial [Burkholderiaceae bacterium]|nr:hypothetical protein [Burkholderiaceae bacterium]
MGIDDPRRSPSRRLEWLVACTAALAGCTMGPNFHQPEDAAPPPQWAAASAPALGGATSKPVAQAFDGRGWWHVFKDPILDALVDDAVRQNLDL